MAEVPYKKRTPTGPGTVSFWPSVSTQRAGLFSIRGRAMRRDCSAAAKGVGKYNLSQEDKCLKIITWREREVRSSRAPALRCVEGYYCRELTSPLQESKLSHQRNWEP